MHSLYITYLRSNVALGIRINATIVDISAADVRYVPLFSELPSFSLDVLHANISIGFDKFLVKV